MIDSDLAELVDDDGDAAAVVPGQYAVDERGFARAQKPRHDHDGRSLCTSDVVHSGLPPSSFSMRCGVKHSYKRVAPRFIPPPERARSTAFAPPPRGKCCRV